MQLSSPEGMMPLKIEAGKLLLVDQRKLPFALEYFDATSLDDVCFAISEMVVRGAPSIGVVAGFGLAFECKRLLDASDFLVRVDKARARLAATRPTAVNLVWALDKIWETVRSAGGGAEAAAAAMACAEAILREHLDANLAIGRFGLALVPENARFITHCNAGALAACGYGTALSVIRESHFAGRNVSVFVDETRPRNQGARLTMFELTNDGVPATLVCESMTGYLMASKKVDLVIVGADRIARNGDTANKIGTYNLAVLAKYHGIPFYVAAPLSTFDANLQSGENIPIEQRSEIEVLEFDGHAHTVSGARALNPAFDVTPGELIEAIITEKGILRRPYLDSIKSQLAVI